MVDRAVCSGLAPILSSVMGEFPANEYRWFYRYRCCWTRSSRAGLEVHVGSIIRTQTMQTATKGYSKRLRHLPRTQRVCVGMLREMLNDPDLNMSIEHCPTLQMKADIFTNALNGPRFQAALAMIRVG